MKLRISVKAKVILMIAVITVCLGVVAALTAMHMTKRAISNIALGHIKTVAAQQKAATEHIFEDSISFAQHLGEHRQLVTYLQQLSPQEQDPHILAYINGLSRSDQYQAIYIMNREGTVLASTDPAFIGQNYGFRDYAKSALIGQPAIDEIISVTDKKFGYYFSHPIKTDSGEILGVVAIKLKDGLIADALQPKNLSAEGASMLVDQYGIVIESSRPELQFKSLGILTPEMRMEITKTKRFGDIFIEPIGYGQAAENLGSLQENSREFVSYNEVVGRDELVGVARVKGTPFFVVSTEAWQFFVQPAGNIPGDSGILVLIMALLGMGMLITLMLWVIRPVIILKKAAQQISEDVAIERVSIETGDEFEDLGEALNMIIDRVRAGYSIAENKIWGRAADFEKFKLAVESASDHIIITDIDGRILYVNKAVEEVTGYSRKELIGNRPSIWGRQMSKKFYDDMWETIKGRKQSFRAEVMNKRKNGVQYAAEIHIAPLLDDKGGLHGFVGIERDITTQKNIDRSKTDFISIASHQLRTPLAAINWYTEMLSNKSVGPVNEAQQKYLEQIHEASVRMVDLIGSLLSVSRIDTGSLYMEPEPVLLPLVADSVIEELKRMAEKKHITIVKEYESNLKPINVDQNMIRIVLQNLLSNAIKYTPENGAVTVSITRDDNNATMTVTDTGYGIPAAQQSMIFTKFFRADNARKKEPDGNGLGLYISKSIIDHAQGTIGFSSEEGKGSIFRVSLPLTGMKKQAKHHAL